MCGQRRIRKLNNAAEGHLSRSLFWYFDSTSCQYIQRWLQKQLSGSKSSCGDLRGCDHTRRFPEHTCIFYCLFWMFGRSTQGLNDSEAPRAGQKPWNMSRMTDIYVPALLLLRCFQEDTTVQAQVEI